MLFAVEHEIERHADVSRHAVDSAFSSYGKMENADLFDIPSSIPS